MLFRPPLRQGWPALSLWPMLFPEGRVLLLVGSPTASCTSGGLAEAMPPFSPSTAKGLVAGTGSASFPDVDGGAVPRLGSEEAGLEHFTFSSSMTKA